MVAHRRCHQFVPPLSASDCRIGEPCHVHLAPRLLDEIQSVRETRRVCTACREGVGSRNLRTRTKPFWIARQLSERSGSAGKLPVKTVLAAPSVDPCLFSSHSEVTTQPHHCRSGDISPILQPSCLSPGSPPCAVHAIAAVARNMIWIDADQRCGEASKRCGRT